MAQSGQGPHQDQRGGDAGELADQRGQAEVAVWMDSHAFTTSTLPRWNTVRIRGPIPGAVIEAHGLDIVFSHPEHVAKVDLSLDLLVTLSSGGGETWIKQAALLELEIDGKRPLPGGLRTPCADHAAVHVERDGLRDRLG